MKKLLLTIGIALMGLVSYGQDTISWPFQTTHIGTIESTDTLLIDDGTTARDMSVGDLTTFMGLNITTFTTPIVVSGIVHDSLTALLGAAEEGIALADSTGYSEGNYVTHTQLDATNADVKLLSESWLFFTYGYGSYVAADSVLADSGRIYGARYILADSIDFTYAVPMLSTGDSIVVRAMYNDTVAINGTVLDTLYLGSSVATIDISSWTTLPSGQIVWVQSMERIPTKDPIFMELELYGIIKRD